MFFVYDTLKGLFNSAKKNYIITEGTKVTEKNFKKESKKRKFLLEGEKYLWWCLSDK